MLTQFMNTVKILQLDIYSIYRGNESIFMNHQKLEGLRLYSFVCYINILISSKNNKEFEYGIKFVRWFYLSF